MTKIVRETVADRTVALLRRRILSGELRPGDAVTEEAMAAELGISRPTVRQALTALELSGLLTRHPSTRVLEVTTLSREDIVEIYRTRRFLELAGVDAAADLPPEGLVPVQQTVLQMEKAFQEDDVDEFVQADYRCHQAVVALLRSRYLSEMYDGLLAKLRLAVTQVTAEEQDNEKTLARHREFCELLTAGEIDRARANLEQRLLEAEQSILPKATSA